MGTEAAWASVRDSTVTNSKSVDELSKDYAGMVASLRGTFNTGKTQDLKWRRQQLEQVIKMIGENHEEITAACRADLGGPKLRGVAELGGAGNAHTCLDNLNNWASEKWVSGWATRECVRPEPKGVVLIIAPWNFPFAMCFQPLVPAIAAGNCVVIKPSEMNPTCAPLIAKLVKKYMDPDCVRVVEGAIPETTGLLNQCWDHIFYTGNGAIGRVVMTAAAKNLTPVTLELGGKSPVIVDETANMDATVNRISLAKWMNCGQICVAPDYVLVQESRADELLKRLKDSVHQSYGDNPKESKDWGQIVNERHAGRVKRLIETSGGEVICGGAATIDEAARFVPPTIIKDPKDDSALMNEEVFGPVLAVKTYKTLDEATKLINSKEVPLALYTYSENSATIEKILNTVPSGGSCVNSSLEQVMSDTIPFGGKGASGMGCYHGKFGFDEFSHKRGIIRKSTFPGMRGPVFPLPDKDKPVPDFVYSIAVKMSTGFIPRSAWVTIRYATYAGMLAFFVNMGVPTYVAVCAAGILYDWSRR